MKRFLSASFRNRLFTALLAASLIPLLICSAVLLQIFRLQMTSREEHEAEVSLGEASQILTRTRDSLLDAAEAVASDGIISAALSESRRDDAAVYNRFLELTGTLRYDASLELYDSGGVWLYSTRSGEHEDSLPTNWGILHAAAGGSEPVFMPGNSSDADGPLLTGAIPLSDGGSSPGFLLMNLYL